MRFLLDTNVVLDLLLQRGEWLADADRIWQANAEGQLVACITASALTDIYYVSRRLAGQLRARDAVRACLDALTILSVDQEALAAAFARGGSDFEDDLQIACAERYSVDAIVTRDLDGFAGSSSLLLSPARLIAQLPP